MELRNYISESLEQMRGRTLASVKDLTPEDLTWRPGPEANHVAFLLWHVARSEDALFNVWIMGGKQVWTTQGWHSRFGLKPEDSGRDWTPQQIGAWSPPALSELLQYMSEVRESVLTGLNKLDLGRLGEKPRPDRPDMTMANILQLIVTHEAHHQGAIDYLIGLKNAGAS